MRRLIHESVLVLNKHFLAIQVTIAKEAVCALVTGKAEVVDQNYSTYDLRQWQEYTKSADPSMYAGLIRSPSVQILVPQVIRIPDCEFNNPVIKTVKYSRRNVYQRDDFTCQYCRRKFPKDKLTLDHVIPKSRGGKSSWVNVVTCCKRCNEDKGDRLLEELGWELPVQPKRPRWRSHIGVPFNNTKKEYWEQFLG